MSAMHYLAPNTVAEAVSHLSTAQSPIKVLAGGTDLLVQMRAGVQHPATIVDIKKIPEARAITIDKGKVIVGAAVSGAEFNEHETLPSLWPGLAEAFDIIGSTQVQGRATLAGNLCNASPAADSVPALIAAGAVANIVGPNGTRQVPVEQIPVSPGKTSLAAGEFIVSFELPARPPFSADAYLRLTPRTEMDIAVVGVAVNLTLDGNGECITARVALGAVAPTALLVEAAANALIGTRVDEAALSNLQQAASAACNPIDDKRGTIIYRTQIAGVLAKRAALIALARAQS